MNDGEILDLFIRAALVDHRLPHAPVPAKLRAQSLPFVHSHEERAGWTPADFDGDNIVTRKNHLGVDVPLTEAQRHLRKRQANDRLEYGDTGRLAIQADQFWEGDRITPSQVTEMEYALDLVRSVSRERPRRCLWAYAKSKAKVLFEEEDETVIVVPDDGKKRRRPYAFTDRKRKRLSFSKWCVEVEDIHRNYGKTCVEHAISEIASKVFGKALFPNENGQNGTLQNVADLRHLHATMDDDAKTRHLTPDGWCVADKDKALRRFDRELIHIPLSDLKKARRRARDKKRQAA